MRAIAIKLLISVGLLLVLISCTADSAPTNPSNADRPNVLVSTAILADVVAQIGGEHIQLTTLVPPGSDPHSFEASPSDLSRMAQADLIFINGLGLEESLMGFLDDLEEPEKIVAVSEGLPFAYIANQGVELGDEHEDLDHSSELVDPHVWMNPQAVIHWSQRIAAALAELDPQHAGLYQLAAAAYNAELEALDVWAQTRLQEIPAARRLLITDHDSLAYFAEHYALDVVGSVLPGTSSLSAASAGALAELEAAIADYQVPAIFVSSAVSSDIIQQIAADGGIEVVQIYVGALSSPDGPAPSYLEMMCYNVNAIVAALK